RTVTLALGLFALTAAAEAGKRKKTDDSALVRVESASDFATTLAHLDQALADRALGVFAKIDHTAAATGVDLDLPPTTVVIFGNPKVGTRLMQASPTMGLDLPMKILVTEPTPGTVTVVYRPIRALAADHRVADRDEVLAKVTEVFAGIVADTTR
ncbi:MAG: DUF302 domain-containing protein, partial [Myxococcota bacterium]